MIYRIFEHIVMNSVGGSSSGTGTNDAPSLVAGKNKTLISRTVEDVLCQVPYTKDYTPPECYRIESAWYTDGDSIVNVPISNPYAFSYSEASVSESRSININIVKDEVVIAINTGDNGSTDKPASQRVCRGTNFEYTITPNSGYRIESVTVDGVAQSFDQDGDTLTISNVQDSRTIDIDFEPSTVTITVQASGNGGSVTNLGVNQVQIGANFTVTASLGAGGVIASFLVDGSEKSISNPDQNNSHTFSNVSVNHTVTVQFITIRQSLGFMAYPGNLVIQPIAFRNNGLQVWEDVRGGDGSSQHTTGFGLNNAVNRLRFWDGTALNSLTLRSDFNTAQTDFRSEMGFDNTNSRHKIRIDRADGGYFEATGRAETRVNESQNTVGCNTRTCRVWLSGVSQGNLVFSVITSMQDASGAANPSGTTASVSMTVNGASQTISDTLQSSAKTINVSNLSTGTYTVRVQMTIGGESDTYYCEGTYVIS